jgi:glycogen synthase
MRILFCSRRYFPAISGMSVYAQNFLRELVAAGHDVTMVSQYRGDETGTRIYGGGPPPPLDGVRIIGRRSLGEENGGEFERDVEDLIATIRAEHARQPFDLLHAQYGYPNGWSVLLAARELGIPSVVSIQGGDGHWVGSCCEMHRLAMVRVIEHANAVLIGCESFAQEVVERLGVDRDRFTIVPGAVDTTRFMPEPGRQPGDAADPVRMLYHGRVDRRKGSLDFMDALAILRRDGVPFAATVSGIGPDLDATKERAAEHGIADAVRFSGYADYDAAPAVYHEQDVFVSPTYMEGFSNTVLEAMASALPIVSCVAVGVMDCLRDNENGLLVQPGDVPAQAAALRRVVEDAALRRRLATAALEECRSTYSWKPVGRQIMQVYADVLHQAPSTAFDPALPRSPCRYRDAPHLL